MNASTAVETKQAQHTPTPWTAGFTPIVGVSRIYSVAPYRTAEVALEVPSANAAHIVRCVNAHGELVAFVESFLKAWAGAGATDSPLEAQARAILAKVKS